MSAVVVVAVVAAAVPLFAQPAGIPTFDIWDVQLGEPVTQIPYYEIAFAACGTKGGPPSTVLNTLENYSACPAEQSGLHEVYFEYDDEQTYIARALRAEWEAQLAGTSMYGHPIIPSVLVDDQGTVRGIRVVTDDRIQVTTGELTPADVRAMSYRLAVNLKGQFSSWNLECTQIPPGEGQTPVGGTFVHEVCRGEEASLGQRMVIDAHYFRRPGQAAIDVHNQQLVEGAFESKTWFELVQFPYELATAHQPGETVERER